MFSQESNNEYQGQTKEITIKLCNISMCNTQTNLQINQSIIDQSGRTIYWKLITAQDQPHFSILNCENEWIEQYTELKQSKYDLLWHNIFSNVQAADDLLKNLNSDSSEDATKMQLSASLLSSSTVRRQNLQMQWLPGKWCNPRFIIANTRSSMAKRATNLAAQRWVPDTNLSTQLQIGFRFSRCQMTPQTVISYMRAKYPWNSLHTADKTYKKLSSIWDGHRLSCH